MDEFKFLQNPISKEWVILAPRRASRPNVAQGSEPVCPFCVGKEKDEQELFRIGGSNGDKNWKVRVIPNKYPFTAIHEIIIHSQDHHNNFGNLPLPQVELIIQAYKSRYLTHSDKGQVYIFHNHGEGGGESLPHPHSQLAVVPYAVKMDIPRLDPSASAGIGPSPEGLKTAQSKEEKEDSVETKNFYLFCPRTSQWPDEVWIVPKARGRAFGDILEEEIKDLAFILSRLIEILNLRHGNEFPFNFYIYPGGDWYLRIIPRIKCLGGFEIGTNVFINTQNPCETIEFINQHFKHPDELVIKDQQQANYKTKV